MSFLLSSFPETLACAVAEAGGGARQRHPGERMSQQASTPPPDDRQIVDARLMQRAARGDKEAFAELYDRFSGPLYATALRIVRDATEAQDIVHDAFLVVWDKAATFEPQRGSAFSWAVTLVRNRAIDRVRSRQRRAELLDESVPADLGYQENAIGADVAASSDAAQKVRSAVSTLPVEQRRALELAFFGGLTQEQIARTLREPLGTVKARIRRGLLKLREALAYRP
jgi:RNA polymerase sigma-70 factor (ECF subfamily)